MLGDNDQQKITKSYPFQMSKTWKSSAGRKSGKDGYVLGDLTRSAITQIFGKSKSKIDSAHYDLRETFTETSQINESTKNQSNHDISPAPISLHAITKSEESSFIDPEFYCPICNKVMDDPVVCADGNSYERTYIEQWLVDYDVSPLTGERLPHKVLYDNNVLKRMIHKQALKHLF